jgi:exonuclease III
LPLGTPVILAGDYNAMPTDLDVYKPDTWLGQCEAPVDEVKACPRTVEGVRWTMRKEERAVSKAKRAKPTVRDPGGLL